MANETENQKSFFQIGKSFAFYWAVLTGLATGWVCRYFGAPWEAVLAASAAAVLLLTISWRFLWWKAQSGLLMELQNFLLRCHILPSDYKIVRHILPSSVQAKKRELMDMGYQIFSESEKKLHETRHILDKFVGTKASIFATEKGGKAVWEGELTRAIVMFSDVRGFTSLSEKLKPQETVRYLNRMFTEFEEVISFSGGEINKFMGDSIMAFFPFPEETPLPDVKKVLLAALQMQDQFHRIEATFKNIYSETVETGLGMGLVGGNVVLGNLGSARRMEFTVIGDSVNFASRLCSIAEDGQILINQDLALIAGDTFRLEELAPVRIKGKSGVHIPYSVLGERLQPGLA